MSTRQRLDREQVLAAAESLVDRDGWRALTMTALAAELGVKVPSLYNHVPNLEALRGELQNRTLREIGTLLNRKAMGRTGPTAMRAIAEEYRRYAKAHPGRYDLATQAPVDLDAFAGASVDAGAALHAVIRSYGIEDADLELQLSAFAALHGVVLLDHVGYFPPGVDADQIFEHVLDALLTMFEAAARPEPMAG